jgi:hypothetical protein
MLALAGIAPHEAEVLGLIASYLNLRAGFQMLYNVTDETLEEAAPRPDWIRSGT